MRDENMNELEASWQCIMLSNKVLSRWSYWAIGETLVKLNGQNNGERDGDRASKVIVK
jgi:hypothetical protein